MHERSRSDLNRNLPDFLHQKYLVLKTDIKKRLLEFSQVPEADYFYELCFCLCTPQSKAESAWKVQQKLAEKDFFNKAFDPTSILREPSHYIRFHNQKAKRLLEAREKYDQILSIIKSDKSNDEKRILIYENVNGFGLKESAHFLRNIGYRNLAILDRHILKHLVHCRVYDEVPKISSKKQYQIVEEKFKEYAENIKIPIDELDLLFWSYEAGKILK
jgi:N-glycosylase/DNA lyase